MKLRQKFIIWFVTISLVIVFVGIAGLYSNNNTVNSYESGEKHFGSIIAASNEVSSYAKRAQGHTMLYLTLHNESDKKKAFMRITSLREQNSIIEENITNPEAIEILGNIKSNTDTLQSIIDSLIKDHDNETKTTGRFEFKNHEMSIRKLDGIAAAIRADGLKLSTVEINLQNDFHESANKEAKIYHNIILLISGTAFFTTLILGYYFDRNISNPIMKLKDAAAKIGNGNLKARTEIESKDEIGELAITFNKMAEDLENSIDDQKRAQQIQLENERLIYASKAKSEFLANMSHELRTPLNAIIGFSELLKMGGGLNEKQEHYLDNVLTSSKFLLDLINEILDLSKVEAGRMELAIEKVSVPAMINETITLFKEKAAKNNIVLKKDLDAQLDFIEIDQQRFKQVLFNLLSNAVKFSKKEGGTVTVTSKREGNMAKFQVSDTGIGIMEEDMGKLFKAFDQLDTGISREYGGTGLGLAISKKMVELHDGKIMAESRYGIGSTFTFILPIKAKERDKMTRGG